MKCRLVAGMAALAVFAGLAAGCAPDPPPPPCPSSSSVAWHIGDTDNGPKLGPGPWQVVTDAGLYSSASGFLTVTSEWPGSVAILVTSEGFPTGFYPAGSSLLSIQTAWRTQYTHQEATISYTDVSGHPTAFPPFTHDGLVPGGMGISVLTGPGGTVNVTVSGSC